MRHRLCNANGIVLAEIDLEDTIWKLCEFPNSTKFVNHELIVMITEKTGYVEYAENRIKGEWQRMDDIHLDSRYLVEGQSITYPAGMFTLGWVKVDTATLGEQS